MQGSRSGERGRITRSVILALAMCLMLVAGPLSAAAQTAAPAVVSPEVIHTGTGPTGYTVTFRYYDPTATSMRIKGEWFFSDAASASSAPPTSAGRLPSQWQMGDFPIGSPNDTAANWPVNDMILDPATGVWSFTTPLPSGVFTYAFYKNCTAAAPALTGCTALADPANLPWNEPVQAPGSVERSSQVYVPSDPAFGTVDYSWQAPVAARGALAQVTYPSPLSTNPVGSHQLVVYTPPSYDPNRAVPYPTLYLSHGGGGNEVDWSTQGVAGTIIDNLIQAGKVQPMVVVMTYFSNLAAPPLTAVEAYGKDVVDNVIPYVEANYNVSKQASGRAFAGLSAGGVRGTGLLLNYPTAFDYFELMSTGTRDAIPGTDPRWANPELKNLLALRFGAGNDDPVLYATTAAIQAATTNNVPFTTKFIDGGHEWYVWRILLADLVNTMAFRHTTTTVTRDGSADRGLFDFTVTVKASTTEPATPSGLVQFYVDGQKLDTPRPVRDGVAKLLIARARLSAGQHTVTAVYSGDNLYNTSAGELVVTR